MKIRSHYTSSVSGSIELEDREEVIGVLETRSISTPLQIVTMTEVKE